MAAANTLTAGAVLTDIVGQKVAGLMALMVASLQAGTAVYQKTVKESDRGTGRHAAP